MTLNLLVAYIKKLIERKACLEIRVRLHKGSISAKVNRVEDLEDMYR